VRRLEQAQEGGGLLLEAGLGAEVLARQVGETELFFGREFPGQRKRLPVSSSTWAEASASDSTRPV
jgi:hypothetical protein